MKTPLFVTPAKAGVQGVSQTLVKFVPIILALTVFLIPACKVTPPKPRLVETIAVLPFDNESNNIDADTIMQRLVYLALKPSAYRVSDYKEVNEFLANVGIVDGGQLAAVDPVKLGKDLGVQALMYGNVESFSYVNIGFFRNRKVNLELRLVDVGTGQVLWENAGGASSPKLTLDQEEAAQEFGRGLADQFIDKVLKTPLAEEAKAATQNALSTLPGFVFRGFSTDDKTPSGVTEATKEFLKNKNEGH